MCAVLHMFCEGACASDCTCVRVYIRVRVRVCAVVRTGAWVGATCHINFVVVIVSSSSLSFFRGRKNTPPRRCVMFSHVKKYLRPQSTTPQQLWIFV